MFLWLLDVHQLLLNAACVPAIDARAPGHHLAIGSQRCKGALGALELHLGALKMAIIACKLDRT